MKQTNNAIKFLMAQYRAIFKSAYIKGLATAVVLTSALAAGQAQAAPLTGSDTWEKAEDQTVTSTTHESVDGTKRFFNNLTIGNAGSVTITDASAAHGNATSIKNVLTVESGGTLTVNGGALAGWKTVADKDESNALSSTATGDLIVKNGGKFIMTSGSHAGWVQMDQVILESGSKNTISGGTSAPAKWYEGTMIYGKQITVAKGATVDLTNAQMGVDSNGTLTVNGKVTLNSGSFLRAADNSEGSGKIILGEEAQITAASGSTGGIYSKYLDIQKDASITLASGSEFQIGGDFASGESGAVGTAKTDAGSIELNGGTITVASGGELSIVGTNKDATTNKDINSSLTVNSGTIENNGTTNISGDVSFADSADAKLTGSGSVAIGASGSLNLSSSQLTDFLDSKGQVNFTAGGELGFTDEKVDLTELANYLGSGDTAGKINLSNSALTGNITMSGKIDGIGNIITLKDVSELGWDTYNGRTEDLGVKQATASSDLLLKGSGGEFYIDETTIELARDYYLRNDDGTVKRDACGTPLENTSASVYGADLTLAKSGAGSKLDVKEGNWTFDRKLTLDGGVIEVTNTNPENRKDPTQSKLTLGKDLVFTVKASGDSIVVSGSGSTLDLTNATISGLSDPTANDTSIKVVNNGVLIMNGDDVEDILANTSKVGLKLFDTNGGELQVNGDVTFNFNDFGSAAPGVITMGKDSLINVAGNATLKTAASTTKLDFGLGAIEADTITLTNIEVTTGADGTKTPATDVTVSVGNLIAHNGLEVTNDNLNLGEGNSAAATLTLGDSDLWYDNKATGGTVSAKKITLGNSGALTTYGEWSHDGSITLNAGATAEFNGVFAGDDLTVSAGNVSVNAPLYDEQIASKVSFNTVTASSSGAINVSGNLHIAGKVVAGTGNSANTTNPYGVNIAADSITVNKHGTLSFGNIASDNAFTVAGDVVTLGTGFNTIDLNGGTVAFDFDKSFTNGLSAKALVSLKTKMLHGTGTNGAIKGWLDIGDTSITDLSSILKPGKDSSYYTATQAAYAPIVDVLSNVKNEQVQNLLLTEVKDPVKGAYGALQSNGSQKTITINDDTILANAGINGGNFASVGTTSALASLNVTSSELILDSDNSAGQAGTISLDSTSELTLQGANAIALEAIDGSGNIYATANTTVSGNVKGDELDTAANMVVAGNVKVNSISNNDGENLKGGSLTAKNIDVAGFVDFAGGFMTADNITLQGGSFIDNAVLTANKQLSLKGDLALGQASVDSTCPDVEPVIGSAGFMDAYELDMGGNTITLDPDYNHQASVGAAQFFKGHNEFNGAGTANGNIQIGQNSVFAIGASLKDTLAAIKALDLTGDNGALDQENGAILYVNNSFTLAQGKRILIDNEATATDFGRTNKPYDKHQMYVGAQSGLVITDNAMGKDMTGTAITFQDKSASIFAEDGATILLSGKRFSTNASYNFFKDGDAAGQEGVDIVGKSGDGTITVKTENGLLLTSLTGKNQGQNVSLSLNPNSRSILGGASDPVYDTIIKYARNDLDGDATTTDDILVGYGYTEESLKAYEASNPKNEELLVANPADNKLLTASVNTGNGAAAETAARLGIYGGSVQAALAAGKSSTDAVASRMGIGGNGSQLTTAENGQGGALWVAPIYRNNDSDGFDVEGLDYGVDLNLYGVALGGDFAVMPGFRVGAMFNVGSGDADGQGAGSNASGDFDYYGFNIYGGYTAGALSLAADLGYSAVSNDVTAASGLSDIGELSADADAKVFSLGVTAQYTLNVSGYEIAPHAGARFQMIDLDDYEIKSAVAGTVGSYDADKLNVFSIPVGVTIAREFQGEEWNVKPSFDLTLTGNFGDDAEGSVSWEGIKNLSTDVKSEVMDSFTYGAAVGISATTGNFSLGAGLNYTGSSNADEFGVSANARYIF